jgi:methionyl-tRNA formyltransferase
MTDERSASTTNPPRVVLFGMRCRFSASVMNAFLARGGEIVGVLLAGEPGEATGRELPLKHRYAGPGTLEGIAEAANIPVRVVADPRSPVLLGALHDWRPDAIAVACFPKRLPREALAFPRLGALNLHPSLLPRHRGPDPLFWTFHDDDRQTGVTIHLMSDRFDAGPIVAQTALDLPFGIEGADLEARLARLGGELLVDAIAKRRHGDFHAIAQDERAASLEGFPNEDDLLISTERSGRWAFSFVRGVASIGFSATILIVQTGERLEIEEAHSYAAGVRQTPLIVRKNDRISVQFIDGICEFSVKELRKTIKLRIDTGDGVVR